MANVRPTFDRGQIVPGDREMSRRVREFDCATSALGPIGRWPEGLRTIVEVMLDSRFPMWLGWGADFTFLYNDAYAQMTLGPKHPWALGKSALVELGPIAFWGMRLSLGGQLGFTCVSGSQG